MEYLETKRMFISEFVDELEHSNLSIFLGAGMSFETGLPSWKNLLKSLAFKINIDIDKANDYYQIAQYCENKLGSARFRNEITSLLNPKNYSSNIAKSILDLPANNFWTTNFDRVLEKNIEIEFGTHPDIIYRDVDLTKTREKAAKVIFKMNGHIDDQMSWVLTKHDLEEYAHAHQAMLTFFKRELIVNTFLFLGYSFTDTLVLSALRDVRRCLGGILPTHYHYTILTERAYDPEFPHFVENLEKSYGIKSLIIPKDYFPVEFSDSELIAQFDAERIKIINAVNHRIRMHQIFISGSFRDIDLEKKVFSSKLAKCIAANILQQGYRICSGVGRGVGSRIIGYASEWLVDHNQLADKKLAMRSSSYHSQDGTNAATKEYRKRLMRDSGIAIFMFGQSESNASRSEGVRQEFIIAKELGMRIIPLGVTGYESLKIWEEIKENISSYGYLEKYIDTLKSETDVDKLTGIIMAIIKDVQ
jgi:hypothetical protein